MSDLTYTPTRQAALGAMQKAQDGYATARQAMERVNGIETQLDELRGENAELKARLVRIEAEQEDLRRRWEDLLLARPATEAKKSRRLAA